MKHLSLYSGIGAAVAAAVAAGMTEVAMCDAEPFCRKVLAKNFPGVPIFTYDTEVTLESLRQKGVDYVDVISGGFPCQPFSTAGKQAGADDPRNRWPEMRRVVEDLQPRWVLGENVRGLVSSGYLDIVCSDLEALGYEVFPVLLPTGAIVGAPHRRERVFILAHTRREGQQPGGVRSGDTSLGETQNLRDTNSSQTLGREYWSLGKPRLSGDPYGISYWVNQPRWPAGRGEPQYDWEPPRLTNRKELRRERIKALGNSAVPQALFPFFQLMMEYENDTTKFGATSFSVAVQETVKRLGNPTRV